MLLKVLLQIYKEKVSGSTRHRPQLEEVLRYLRKGDQLIVTSMDRLARSLVDLHTIVEGLVGRGVSVRFLREGQTYSAKADPIAKLMLGLMGSVAEFEPPSSRSARLRASPERRRAGSTRVGRRCLVVLTGDVDQT